MLRFVDLPRTYQAILLVVLLTGMSGMLMLRMIISALKHTYFILHYSIIVWLASFATISILTVELNQKVALISWYPVWLHIAFAIIQLMLVVNGFVMEEKKRKVSFVRNSIKEAIDNLPIGMCFSNSNGRIILANKNMYHLIFRLTGKAVINVENLWDELKAGREFPRARKLIEYSSDDMVSLETYNHEVYQIMRRTISLGDKEYYETKVYMVTRLHELMSEISVENEHLKAQHQEIKKLAGQMIRNNHEEELLNRKIQLHNTMGQYILATRQLLKKGGNLNEYYQLAMDWQNMTRQAVSMEDNYRKNYAELLEEILNVAEEIGCKVTIADSVPASIFEKQLARQAVRESIINAVKHGSATEVFIDYDSTIDRENLTISNNGSLAEGTNEPKGGLKNLEDGIKASGGSLKIITDDKFMIKIIF